MKKAKKPARSSNATKLPKLPKDILDDLVLGNKILAHYGVVDAFGHLSVRHPTEPNFYFMSRHLPPGMVTHKDIVTFDLDSNPLTHSDRPQYSERFIHGEIYKLRPEVTSVVHCHARSLLPFGSAKGARLRPMSHMCGFLGCGVPIFEIREAGGNTDMLIRTGHLGKALAEKLADKNVVLMRGHGATMIGQSIQESVYRAYYSMDNAAVQMEAHLLAHGGEVEFLNEEESEKSMRGRNIPRAWSLWKHEMTAR